jgi:5-methylcytosine-specific restriction endonuclease McrA
VPCGGGMTQVIQPNTSVLVLNSSFEPINITNWKRAIVLLLKEKAQILSHRVIRLLNYVKIPISKIVSHRPSKAMIYKRDNNSCQYCGSTRHLTIDHVIPKSKGGSEEWTNLVVACSKCNTKKGDKLLSQTDMKLIKQPKAPHNTMQIKLNQSGVNEWEEYVF